MKYYTALFGKNSESRHTKTYIYKSEEDYSVGMTVIVPAKGKRKVALVHSVLEVIPSAVGIRKEQVRSIIGRNDTPLDSEKISDYIIALIDEYKDGVIQKEVIIEIIDMLRRYNTLHYENDGRLTTVLDEVFPKLCSLCDREIEEFQFWKLLKDCENLLFYGKIFDSAKNEMICMKDPIEYTDAYLKVELEVEKLVIAEIGEERHWGYCHRYWHAKKKILKDRYNIDWKSPADMNPHIFFD